GRSSTFSIAVVLSGGAVTPGNRYPTKLAGTRTGWHQRSRQPVPVGSPVTGKRGPLGASRGTSYHARYGGPSESATGLAAARGLSPEQRRRPVSVRRPRPALPGPRHTGPVPHTAPTPA